MPFTARLLFVGLFLLLLSVQGRAQLKFRLAYFHDGKPVDLHRVAALSFTPLRPGEHPPVFSQRGPYLFRIELFQVAASAGSALFIENEHLDTVSLYSQRGDSLLLLGRQGNDLVAAGKRLGFPEFMLPGRDSIYYLQITFKKDVSLPLHIDSQKELEERLRHIFFQLGLYYGACLLFFVFNLLLFIYLKDNIFLYYCFFQLFIVGSIAYADGLCSFITSWSWLLDHADLPLHLGMAVSGSLFAQALLETPKQRRWKRISAALLILILLAFSGSALSGSYPLFLTGEAFTFLLLFGLWSLGLLQFKKHAYSRFFVFGYGLFLVFAVDYFLLRKLGIFWLDWFPAQLKMGSIVETLVLSIAIISRIKTLQDENMHYRQEIAQYMRQAAQQVADGTAGLENMFERTRFKYGLTDRELEVLRGISGGLTNQEIADRIFLSLHTVKFHTRNIFDKMEITNRTQALKRLHTET